jgi:hypothetical protein
MCVVEENGKPRFAAPGVPEQRVVYLRRGDYEILDTRQVGGLRGTGSHDVVVDGARAPLRPRWQPVADRGERTIAVVGGTRRNVGRIGVPRFDQARQPHP